MILNKNVLSKQVVVSISKFISIFNSVRTQTIARIPS
jgi:hypothetical protein